MSSIVLHRQSRVIALPPPGAIGVPSVRNWDFGERRRLALARFEFGIDRSATVMPRSAPIRNAA